MKRKRTGLSAIGLVAAIVALGAGCGDGNGGGEASSVAQTETPTSRPSPTATPASRATSTSVPTATLPPTATRPPTATPSPQSTRTATPTERTVPECDREFESTFAGIQEVIFEQHGCTNALCHGAASAGGLRLSADVAYENIFQRRALGSPLNLIEPGDEDRSYLWLKLAAGTRPGRYEINGAPMPNALPPISEQELELLRLWIYSGAPKDGTIIGSDRLLNACLPDPEPISIEPLDPPAPDEGIQLVMPPWLLRAGSEFEGCFATYYDFTDQVPEQFKNPGGNLFRWKGFEVRQDPQSHHLLLYYSPLNFEPGGIDVHHPSFGKWTCMGGAKQGEECEPKDLGFCGEGSVCASRFVPSFACIGYGPPSPQPAQIVGGAPQAQTNFIFAEGVYQQLPMKGVIYWNTHAFNLTSKDHVMNGRVNFYFAESQIYQAVRISNFSAIFKPNNPPFTKETFCNDHVFPIGSRVFLLFAHTHKHGEHFWATDPDGRVIYESFDYSDPVQQRYNPPLAFDDPDPARRTVRYCAVFNNGVKPDGTPDVELVTRASRVPPVAQQFIGRCTPVACVAGKVAAPCRSNADCDSTPGAGDGFCDACPITGGESTENEMFVLFGAQYIDPSVPGAELHLLPYPEED